MSEQTDRRRAMLTKALEEHSDVLVGYARKLLGDWDLARDVVQDVMVKLIQAESLPADGALKSWLFRVCRNRAIDIIRKERRMNFLESPGETTPDPAMSPAAAVELGDTVSGVLAMLDTLPTNQREVLRLKFQAELSYREIAEITGHSVSNVGFLIHTGIRKLRDKLRPTGLLVQGGVA